MNTTAPSITRVSVVGPYTLDLLFSDGSSGVVNLRSWIVGQGPVFKPLEDPAYFAQVRLSQSGGTIEWPNGVDFCPDVLHHKITGTPIDLVATDQSEPLSPNP
jgi:hypothetical protein